MMTSVGTWNPTHLFWLHVGFITQINIMIGRNAHDGTRMCQSCRGKNGDTNGDMMVDHGNKNANEMVTMINGRESNNNLSRMINFGAINLMLTIQIRTQVVWLNF